MEEDGDADNVAMNLSEAGRPDSFIHRKILRRPTHLGDVFHIASSLFSRAKQSRTRPIRTEFLANVPSGGRTFVSRSHDGEIVATIETRQGERVIVRGDELAKIQLASLRLTEEIEPNETRPDIAE